MNVNKCVSYIILTLYFALSVQALFAQEMVSDKLLLPVSPGVIPGAHGSEWRTTLALTNMSDTTVSVDYGEVFCPGLCVPVPIPPHSTIVAVDVLSSPDVRGRFAVVEAGRLADLALTLRSQDVSRQGETWGTVIPVVSQNNLFARRFSLVDIPIESQFRATLRIYDVDASTAASVRVRVFAMKPIQPGSQQSNSDELLLDFVPQFATASGAETLFPSSFEYPLWLAPELANAERVRVEVEPLDQAADYWAFVSVTHNETQHVTVIAPLQ